VPRPRRIRQFFQQLSLVIRVPRLDVVRQHRAERGTRLLRQLRLERGGHGAGDLTLDLEHVLDGHLPVERLRPQVLIRDRIDQLNVEPHAAARGPDSALDDRAHSELPGDVADRAALVSVRHHRGARRHPEIRYLRELGHQVVVQAEGEGLAVVRAGEVGEREDGDRLPGSSGNLRRG
jgi:hypothetical protein